MWGKLAAVIPLFLFVVAAPAAATGESSFGTQPTSPIFEAVQNDDPTEIMNAISAGSDINEIGKGGQTPLVNAILTGKVEAVKTLLELKADYTIPEKDGYTVFHAAGFQGRAEIVKILAEYQDDNGDYAIRDKFLMAKHDDGFYPMHRACWGRQQRHTDTVGAFLELGIPYDLKADNKKSCMTMTKNQKTNTLLMKTATQALIQKEKEESMMMGDEL